MSALARRVCQSYVTQVLDDGFFHADPHPGNILVRDGEVVWIDLGMVGTLTVSERMLVGKVFTAVATDNAYLLKEAVMGLVHVLGPVDHGALLEALSRLLAEYSTAEMKEINVGTVLTEVIEVLRGQNMMMTSSVTMLARGFVTNEGGHCPGRARHQRHRDRVEARHRPAGRPEVFGDAADRSRHDERRFGRGLGEAADPAVEHVGDARPRADQGDGDIEVSSRILATAYASVGSHSSLGRCCRAGGCSWGRLSLVHHGLCSRNCSACPLLGVLGYVGAFVLGAYTVFHILGLPPSPSQQRGAAVGDVGAVRGST